ncbi:DUF2505 domain-containing protein [Nocardia sp. NPDC004068]|uniref:DUF2505 domain-containing protein n=1 Tax=Nocardia sp. NPDC004068 TaxID=3364303 RepID=UPI0036CBD672
MPKTFSEDYDFAVPMAAVHAAMVSRPHWEQRFAAIGEGRTRLTDFRTAGDVVTIAASTEVASALLPRGVGRKRAKEITFDFEESWHPIAGSTATGVFHGWIELGRMTVDALFALSARGDDACALALSGTVESKLPVFGRAVEDTVCQQMVEGFFDNCRFIDAWVRDHSVSGSSRPGS